MSAPDAFKALLCQAYTSRVTHMSLHTADPGTTGAHDSAVAHKALAWPAPSDGLATATAAYTALTGVYTHVGLWEGSTFRQGIACRIAYSTATDVSVMVTHQVGEL